MKQRPEEDDNNPNDLLNNSRQMSRSLFSPGARPIPSALLLLMLALALPGTGCVKRSREVNLTLKSNTQPQANDQQSGNPPQSVSLTDQSNKHLININTASTVDLEKLPGIGKGLAQRIIDHRERFGPFRRAEHLIIVRGISDRRFRAVRDLVTVE